MFILYHYKILQQFKVFGFRLFEAGIANNNYEIIHNTLKSATAQHLALK